jgi:diguanylate cyclase (GGDEF)-like protein
MEPSEIKVLVVDDEPSMLRIIGAWLKGAGYQVRQAADGQEALQAIEADCPHFLLTDWEMPRLDGPGLCRRVRAMSLPHYLYIIFLTGKGAREMVIQGLELGADEFLTKPVNSCELLARMRAGTRVLELERRLSLMARTDSLTGLYTQRFFYEMLQHEFHRAKRYHLPLSCVMMDLDFFKRINDIHGHTAGDAVLKAVADLLTTNRRSADVVCRYGGEEFCVLLPETAEINAAAWAERIRCRISELPIQCGDKVLHVTASFGTAQAHDDIQTPEALVDAADQALLCAKQSGRDRVVRYESLTDADELTLEDAQRYEDLFRGICARHVMTPLVACVRQDDSVGQAAEFFLRSRINSTPVVDAEGLLVGMLSEKDLLGAMISLDCWRLPVREVMKRRVIVYEEDTPIRTIYEFLCRVTIRRVVIAHNGRPTGTISRGTLLRWFRNLVASKGLVADPELAPRDPVDPHRSKERLAQTARELARQAQHLEQRVGQNDEDLVPYVIGCATGMQELVTDLLAYSRYANTGGAVALGQMYAEGASVD